MLFQSDETKKLKKADIITIVILGIILAILSLYSTSASFYDLERGNQFAHVAGIALSIPVWIFTIPLYYLISLTNPRDLESLAFGIGILAAFLSPVFAFVFWFIIFWLLAKISKTFLFHGETFIWKHIISIVIVLFIISPYIYYLTGSNKVDACLSGALNSQMTVSLGGATPEQFTIGPEMCFDRILQPMIFKNNPSSKDVISFCLKLSDQKIIAGTQSSYRDYCIYTLGQNLIPNKNSTPDFTTDFHRAYMSQLPLPTYAELIDRETDNKWWATYETKLCDVYGSLTNSQDENDQCLIYYINYTTSPDDTMTQIYCKGLTGAVIPQRCTAGAQDRITQPATQALNNSASNIGPTVKPIVSLNVNGSHTPTAVKLNSVMVVSWSATDWADRCEAFGTYVPRADGKGIWGQGNYKILPTNGSMSLIANASKIGFQVQCEANVGKASYVSGSDSVDFTTTN